MARVELFEATTAPLTAQQYFTGGDPGPIVAALASVPELVRPTLEFVSAALGPGATGIRTKEIAILRTSSLQGCTYCVNAHTGVALDAGLSAAEVLALRDERPVCDAFPGDAEQALIRWIDAVAGAIGPIPDDVWIAARAHWAEHELIEVSVTVGATMFLNRFATGLQLPVCPDPLAPVGAEPG